jgi:beta-glucuronidase
MVNNTFNRPSGILFAFLNEGDSSNPASCPTYSTLAARYRSLQVNGLVTWASDKTESDVCLDAADVISFNSYPGWYGGSYDLQQDLQSAVPTIIGEATWVQQHQPGKPFIKSEIGAGGIPGWRDQLRGFWSEEYQAALDGAITNTIATDDRFAGISLWQFCDVRTYTGVNALGRPRSLNNKGVFDEYRRPKLAAGAVAQGFNGSYVGVASIAVQPYT